MTPRESSRVLWLFVAVLVVFHVFAAAVWWTYWITQGQEDVRYRWACYFLNNTEPSCYCAARINEKPTAFYTLSSNSLNINSTRFGS